MLIFSDNIHIGPTVGLGDFGKEAAVDQIYLGGPPVPLTRRWDFAKRWTKGFVCRRPDCWRSPKTGDDGNNYLARWKHV